MAKSKPSWWPQNPYPEDIFPMTVKNYVQLVPDPHTRTALGGCLGRLFWDIASEMIWDRYCEVQSESLNASELYEDKQNA